MKLRRILWAVMAALFLAAPPAHCEGGNGTVKMAPLVVEGSYSDVWFGAQFRHHIPGTGLKSLVLTKVPASWIKKGLSVGDTLVAIDGSPIDGKGVVEIVRFFKGKADIPMEFEVLPKDSNQTKKVMVMFKKASGSITIHYP